MTRQAALDTPHGHTKSQWQNHARRQGPWLLTHDSSSERAGKADLCAPDKESYRCSLRRRSPPTHGRGVMGASRAAGVRKGGEERDAEHGQRSHRGV